MRDDISKQMIFRNDYLPEAKLPTYKAGTGGGPCTGVERAGELVGDHGPALWLHQGQNSQHLIRLLL